MEWADALTKLDADLSDIKNGIPVIYVISQFSDVGPYKIGLSYSMVSRMRSYRTAFVNFYIHYMLICPDHKLFETERELHKVLEKDRIPHTQPWEKINKKKPTFSEWFHSSKQEVLGALTNMSIPVITGVKFIPSLGIKQIKLKTYDEGEALPTSKSGRELSGSGKTISARVGGRRWDVLVHSLGLLSKYKKKQMKLIKKRLTADDDTVGYVEEVEGDIVRIRWNDKNTTKPEKFMQEYDVDEVIAFLRENK
jgi:hypothetical protein